jgi:molybdopterin/thiamine biosynthesis adenylyltransferase
MTEVLNRLRDESLALQNIFSPEFFRLSITEDKQRFYDLVKAESIFLSDEIHDQVKELVKSRNPSLRLDDYSELVAKHFGDQPREEYGVWVYYPWSRRMVHILDKDEFIELRTSANKNKITIAERDLLATKKVGVIGLSVGQSVSLTLAMERGCGELRLADFDTLELNNLNRIRTGVHNLGLYKAYAVAREIAEIDPYFKVVVYKDGLTDENIDDFFTGGGKLDAVIDECDSVNIKIQCRLKAKALHVPVLMEASDRGTLDVERFDLHPNRPIMHGWLEHLTLDLNVLKNLKTNDEKVPYMLPISGLDTLSPRMKASMIEMRMTITTWPQLATAVTLGGAVTADTCRRIFLDQFTDSGRYFIDMETIVPDTRPKNGYKPKHVEDLLPDVARAMASKVLGHNPPDSLEISASDLADMVDAATKAPSKGNSQPWLWHWQGKNLFLFLKENNISSYTDFRHMAAYSALGAALENLHIAATSKGLGLEVSYFPLAGEKRLVAAIAFNKNAEQYFHSPAN